MQKSANSDDDIRAALVQQANRTGCSHVGFLWRLRDGGDGWHCYQCEAMPNLPAPALDIELLNVNRARIEVLRQRLTA